MVTLSLAWLSPASPWLRAPPPAVVQSRSLPGPRRWSTTGFSKPLQGCYVPKGRRGGPFFWGWGEERGLGSRQDARAGPQTLSQVTAQTNHKAVLWSATCRNVTGGPCPGRALRQRSTSSPHPRGPPRARSQEDIFGRQNAKPRRAGHRKTQTEKSVSAGRAQAVESGRSEVDRTAVC